MTVASADTPEPLQRELAFYSRNKERFLRHYEGKFVAILGEQFGGAFDTVETAYNEGVRMFAAAQFLVQHVIRTEQVAASHAYENGLIFAPRP